MTYLAAVLAGLSAFAPQTVDVAADRQALVERTVFETCPQVLAGDLSLTDQARLAATGFVGTAPRDTPGGPIPRAEHGTGVAKIVIAGQRKPTERQCSVWFGGPDNATLAKAMLKRAKREGFRKGPTLALGDATKLYKLVRPGGVAPQLTVIEADAGGELDTTPATTVIYLDN